MDFKQIVSLLCVIAFIAVVATGQPEEHIDCPIGQQPVPCPNGIVPTCGNLKKKCGFVCVKAPCETCACKAGRVFAPNGTCIPRLKCPTEEHIKCPEGKKPVGCPNGIVPTCGNPTKKCGFVCIRAPCETCACEGGLLLTPDGKCVTADQCPSGPGSYACPNDAPGIQFCDDADDCPGGSACVDGACQRGLQGKCNPSSAKICCK